MQTETLYHEIEQTFYSKPEKVEPLLKRAGVHDLSALLKRWLRELPQPLLANDLVHLFYQTNGELKVSVKSRLFNASLAFSAQLFQLKIRPERYRCCACFYPTKTATRCVNSSTFSNSSSTCRALTRCQFTTWPQSQRRHSSRPGSFIPPTRMTSPLKCEWRLNVSRKCCQLNFVLLKIVRRLPSH